MCIQKVTLVIERDTQIHLLCKNMYMVKATMYLASNTVHKNEKYDKMKKINNSIIPLTP